jgi:hypothetical protein
LTDQERDRFSRNQVGFRPSPRLLILTPAAFRGATDFERLLQQRFDASRWHLAPEFSDGGQRRQKLGAVAADDLGSVTRLLANLTPSIGSLCLEC